MTPQPTTYPAPGPLDLLFHGSEQAKSHPDATSNVGVILNLRGPAPGIGALRAHIAARIGEIPCLTHYIAGAPPVFSWATSTPDLDEYVLEHDLSGNGPTPEAAVEELRRTALPDDAPPWRLWLLRNDDPDRFAMFYLTRHDVQDAAGICAVLESLFEPVHAPRTSSAIVPEIESTPVSLLDYANALTDIAATTRAHALWTSKKQPLSGRRAVQWVDVPTALLRTLGKAAGASVNDIWLAALAHAVAGWATEHWPMADGANVPIMVPLNHRSAAELGHPGNRFFLGRIELPGGRCSAETRLAKTPPTTTPLKSPARRAALRRIVNALPRPALDLATRAGTSPEHLSIVGSSFPFRHRLRLGDAVIERIAPLICCPDGFPATSGLFVYDRTSTACFHLDTALPGIASLPGRWRRAVDEMAAAHGVVHGETPEQPDPSSSTANARPPLSPLLS